MIIRLRRNHDILCTSRKYREVTKLAKTRKLRLLSIGRHGGAEKYDKLIASTNRTRHLAKIIRHHSPDILISFCSPEAARVAFGLGIRHVAFQDSPHAEAVMRLTIPLVHKLMIPWIVPKKEFIKFGIDKNNIITYRAIDAFVTIQRKVENRFLLDKRKKTILIRLEEEQAAYSVKYKTQIFSVLQKLIQKLSDTNIVVLARYSSQIKILNKKFGNKIKVLTDVIDSKPLLESSDVFIGSGGTMTAESALLGISTISYNAVPNFVEAYLVRKNLVRRETNPIDVVSTVKHFINSSNPKNKIKAKNMLKSMEDPYPKLIKVLKSMK